MADVEGEVVPTDELAGIVIRASRLGFSAARVATALRISPDALASIRQRIAVGDGDAGNPATRRTLNS